MGKLLKVSGLGIMALLVACSSSGTGPTNGSAPNVDATVQALAQVAVEATLQARGQGPPAATSAPQSDGLVTLVVVKSGLDGIPLRDGPVIGQTLRVLKDGAEVLFLSEQRQLDDSIWDQVRDQDGTIGWMPVQFLTTKQALAMAAAEPTAKPAAPAAIPAPADAAEIKTYLASMLPDVQLASQSSTALGTQSEQLSRTPTLLSDTTWTIKTALALVNMKSAGEKMQQYEPVPARAKALDDLMVSVGKDLIYIADEYTAGIDGRSVARINNATTRAAAVNQKMNRATTMIKSLGS